MKHFWKVLVVFLILTQLTLLVSCSYVGITNKKEASKIELVHRPRGTYYGLAELAISMNFNNDTVQIASGFLDYTGTIVGGIKTYKINWQEYDSLYSASEDIQCVPLTEITTGKRQCFWFKYFANYDFILYGWTFVGKFNTSELHKED